MALTGEQRAIVYNRIAESMQKVEDRMAGRFNQGLQRSSYLDGMEKNLVAYEKYVEGYFDIPTVRFDVTMKHVNDTCEFWDAQLALIPD